MTMSREVRGKDQKVTSTRRCRHVRRLLDSMAPVATSDSFWVSPDSTVEGILSSVTDRKSENRNLTRLPGIGCIATVAKQPTVSASWSFPHSNAEYPTHRRSLMQRTIFV